MSFWRITDQEHAQRIYALLDAEQRLALHTPTSESLTVLDDFGWTLWRAGYLLVQQGPRQLILHHQQALEASCTVKPSWRFWWQLPAGIVAEHVQALLGVRAFVPKYTCKLFSQPVTLRNEDEKIVARLCHYHLMGEKKTLHCVQVEDLRGYQDECQQVEQILEQAGAEAMAAQDMRDLLLLSGLQIDTASLKPVFALTPQAPAETTIGEMLQTLVTVARRHEAGIAEDVDTEFVHQTRVNIRKARSLVSLFKKSLTPEKSRRLKTILKEIGSSTNTLRDLDVFLLDADYYRSLLPSDYQEGFRQVLMRVKRQRGRAFRQIVETLASETHQQRGRALDETLVRAPDLSAVEAQRPIKALVQEKLRKQYSRICRKGVVINGDTLDRDVHEMRIECKKLRYLLELFGSLFPPDLITETVRRLKKLQDNLGRFNDVSVQGGFLRQYRKGKQVSSEQRSCIDGLVAVLYQQQLKERRKVEANMADFCDIAVQQVFQALCAHEMEEGA